MKNKIYTVLLVMISIFILTGCNAVNNNQDSKNNNVQEYTKNDVGITIEPKLIEKEIPNLNVLILGHYGDTITKDDLIGIKIYNFDAIVESNQTFYNVNFTGFKMLDFIEWLSLDPNVAKNFTFEGDRLISIKYEFSEFNENSWLIFEKDNKPIVSEGLNSIAFIQVDKDSYNWSYGIESIILSS